MSASAEPYVGPRPFLTIDKENYFGRDRETQELFSLIIAHPVVLFYAASGAGKSSLLNAGVVPMLTERRAQVYDGTRVSGTLPPGICSDDVRNIFTFNALLTLQPEARDAKTLTQMRIAEFLSTRPHNEHKQHTPPPRVIIFDQFEEIFTTTPERWIDREDFFDDIGLALEADRRLRVVFAMREEFIAGVECFASLLPERLRTRFKLDRLREDKALLAVEKPLEGTNRKFAPGAAGKLVRNLLQIPGVSKTADHTGDAEFVEPVHLQVVCRSLWHSLPEEVTEITEDFVTSCGDVDQALSIYYEECVRATAEKVPMSEGVLRRWFGKELIMADDTRNFVRQEQNVTAGLPNAIVSMFDEQHLIHSEVRGRHRWFELAHERFIAPIRRSNEKWRMRLDRISTLFEARSKAWEQADYSTGLLLANADLRRAKAWISDPEAEEIGISDRLRKFVQASEKLGDEERSGAI